MDVQLTPEAVDELKNLPPAERRALSKSIEYLETFGEALGYPHSSHVRGTTLRELRPRSGRSPWRAFYTRYRDALVILAVGPEALQNPRGFERSIRAAVDRLENLEREEES